MFSNKSLLVRYQCNQTKEQQNPEAFERICRGVAVGSAGDLPGSSAAGLVVGPDRRGVRHHVGHVALLVHPVEKVAPGPCKKKGKQGKPFRSQDGVIFGRSVKIEDILLDRIC